MSIRSRLSAIGAALSLAVTLASPASAALKEIDFTINGGGWGFINGPATPYNLPLQPTISGDIIIDDTKADSSGIIGLNYVTGTRAWKLADLDPSSGIFFGGPVPVVNLFFTTQGNFLGTNNSVVIGEGPSTFYCNGCVSIDGFHDFVRSAALEPQTWALTLAGFAALGMTLRRRSAGAGKRQVS